MFCAFYREINMMIVQYMSGLILNINIYFSHLFDLSLSLYVVKSVLQKKKIDASP